ncbi:MAG: DinB family protein [Bacteroidota bacterium]
MRSEMSRTEFIASRLREVLLDGRWVANTNIKAQIENLPWQQAVKKVGSLNTIAVLTFHLNYYLGGVLNVLKGGDLVIRDKYSFDMPPINSESDWKKLMEDFLSNSEEFIRQVAAMEDKQLDEYFVQEKYGSYQRSLEGIIEHSYYHLGQMSLIQKMIAIDKEQV